MGLSQIAVWGATLVVVYAHMLSTDSGDGGSQHSHHRSIADIVPGVVGLFDRRSGRAHAHVPTQPRPRRAPVPRVPANALYHIIIPIAIAVVVLLIIAVIAVVILATVTPLLR